MRCLGDTTLMQWASDGPSQIGIEQGNDATDAGDAKPYGDVFRSIGHQQADDFAFGNTLRRAPIGRID